jgi:hypothetical protein
MENDHKQNSGSTGTSNNSQGSIGSAGSEGTQAYNNGNEGSLGSNKGKEESGAFADESEGGYEGGNLGTAGSGGMDIPSTASSTENEGVSDERVGEGTHHSDKDVVPVPVEKDNYEGGNMGTAGSGGMDVHGSGSSLSVDALSDEHTKSEGTEKTPSKNPHGLGSPPSGNIADGGHGGARQPKEHTGKDTEMGGSTGGSTGLGNGNESSGEGSSNKG